MRSPLTIFKRLVIGNMVILFLIVIMGVVVSYNLSRLQSVNQGLVATNQESIFTGEQIIDTFNMLVQFDEKYFVAKDVDYLNRFNEKKLILADEFKTFYSLMETPEQKEEFETAWHAFQIYLAWFDEKSKIIYSKTPLDFDVLTQERRPYVKPVLTHLNQILTATRNIVTQKNRISGQMTKQIFMVTVLTTLLTVLVGMAITVVNTRSIRNSVQRLQHKTEEIAQGRFEEIQTINGPKEIQDLALHFNTMCHRLKELDELKADFISHVSHELRTPLTSIKEATIMLTKGFYADHPEKQDQLLKLIHGECQRLLNSVMRILDFSKMEAGKMEYRTTCLNLPDLLRKSILKLAPLAHKKKITLEFLPPTPDLPDVRADEDRIIEVLDNIIGNAIKFTPFNGKIEVNCLIKKEKKELLVRVTDSGPGIALEHLEKIFYKFKQIDNDLNTRMGTGLGLCISKYIIKAHGGKIWAENIASNGTRVSFTLPQSP
ncbi:MAG: HAMP domain-containing histidine kinase [Desulfobacterales bacterium]|nr:HAMP domain-containing histidine kinase [Desulfobacterales bacterium]